MLTNARQCLAIIRELGCQRDIAAGLDQCGEILTKMHRFVEADTLYTEALVAANAAMDRPLQGNVLQHRGNLKLQLIPALK